MESQGILPALPPFWTWSRLAASAETHPTTSTPIALSRVVCRTNAHDAALDVQILVSCTTHALQGTAIYELVVSHGPMNGPHCICEIEKVLVISTIVSPRQLSTQVALLSKSFWRLPGSTSYVERKGVAHVLPLASQL